MPIDDEAATGTVIFSLVDGTVWASWTGDRRWVKLGSCKSVTSMMRDFLAQCEVGERLAGRGNR